MNVNVTGTPGEKENLSVLNTLERKSYLTFCLKDENFAVDVKQVREVLDFPNVTRIPGPPDFLRGIFNLNGSMVPVVDILIKFGMPETEIKMSTCVIVIEVGRGPNRMTIGALADSVKGVFEFEPGQIEPTPLFGEKDRMDFIQAVGRRNDQYFIILNFNKVFPSDEMYMLTQSKEK
jgi:purine-binding chemotaxis protein CheW